MGISHLKFCPMSSSNDLTTVADIKPMKVTVEAGKQYSWRSCGLSQNQPFCDGSHRSIEGNEDGSLIQPTRFTAEESKDMWFCMCKATGNADTDGTCDGAHHQEPVILKYNRQLLAANSELKARLPLSRLSPLPPRLPPSLPQELLPSSSS